MICSLLLAWVYALFNANESLYLGRQVLSQDSKGVLWTVNSKGAGPLGSLGPSGARGRLDLRPKDRRGWATGAVCNVCKCLEIWGLGFV